MRRKLSHFSITNIQHVPGAGGGAIELLAGEVPPELFSAPYAPPICAPTFHAGDSLRIEARREPHSFPRRLTAMAEFIEGHQHPALPADFRRVILLGLNSTRELEPGELGEARSSVTKGPLELYRLVFRLERYTPSSKRKWPAACRRGRKGRIA
jgi:hypothetical protein